MSLNEPVVTKLCELVAQYGILLIDDLLRCTGLLKDYCGQHKREVNLLVLALRERVPHELLASASNTPEQMVVSRLARKLHDEHGCAEDFARWAVVAWVRALEKNLTFSIPDSISQAISAPIKEPEKVAARTTTQQETELSEIHKCNKRHLDLLQIWLEEYPNGSWSYPQWIDFLKILEPPYDREFLESYRDSTSPDFLQNIKNEFVLIKGGSFIMGDTFGEGRDNEYPVHEVNLDSFFIKKRLVTQSEWKLIMNNNPSHLKAYSKDCPVVNVSWNDVQNFIRRLNQWTGNSYRLPTEAEWEYAARSGGRNEKWAGNNILSEVNNYTVNSNNSVGKTWPVGIKKPNGLGIYDMCGNVWEWCNDWYEAHYYKTSPKQNPQGPFSGKYRVLRGGSWSDEPFFQRTTYRSRGNPDIRNISFGFRLAASFDDILCKTN